jgi:DMSO reductase anchor subunit
VAIMKRTGKTVQELFTPAYFGCLLVIVGEALGRFLFYAAHIRTGL